METERLKGQIIAVNVCATYEVPRVTAVEKRLLILSLKASATQNSITNPTILTVAVTMDDQVQQSRSVSPPDSPSKMTHWVFHCTLIITAL